jgi:tetratricopeptide (TPR) repeat protein
VILLHSLRQAFADFAARRGRASGASRAALRWHRLACAVAPAFIPSFGVLVEQLRERDDQWGARDVAQRAAERFPGDARAWMLLGQAWLAVYRHPEALASFEQALVLEERPDAALAAGVIYRRSGQFPEAAARFARAYAAGGGPEALRQNAEALFEAGDVQAAEQALALWAGQVPDGALQATALRAKLGASRRAG